MSTTKYGFGNVSLGTTAWNGILSDNMDDIDALLHTYLQITVGVGVVEGKAVAIRSDGKGGLAVAGASSGMKPAIGIAIENGVADDTIRVQRVGPITSTYFSFTYIGSPVYLDTNPGEVTQTRPSEDIQIIGIAIDTDTLLLTGNGAMLNYATTTTTTV